MDKGDDKAFASDMRKSRQKSAKPGAAPIGDALRGIYDRTVEESVPAEMLDLLGKLD